MNWNLNATDEPFGCVDSVLDLKAQHSAKAVEELVRALMLRMAFEARIVDRRNGWMRAEETGHCQRTAILMRHAQRECLHAAMQKKCCVRIQRPAEMVQLARDPIDELAASNAGARDQIRVPIEVLRGAVQRHIEAVFGGAEIDWARKCVVNQGDQAVLAGKLDRGL